jgi:hypothetical protein
VSAEASTDQREARTGLRRAKLVVLAAAVLAHLLLVDPDPLNALLAAAPVAWLVLPTLGRRERPLSTRTRRWVVLGAGVGGLFVGAMLLRRVLPDPAADALGAAVGVAVLVAAVIGFGWWIAAAVRAQLRGTPTGEVRPDAMTEHRGRHPVIADLDRVTPEAAWRSFPVQVLAAALVWTGVEFADRAPTGVVLALAGAAVLLPPLAAGWLTRTGTARTPE